ncbi:hypothetical protein [Haladaptatus sp. NG-WS-4]
MSGIDEHSIEEGVEDAHNIATTRKMEEGGVRLIAEDDSSAPGTRKRCTSSITVM